MSTLTAATEDDGLMIETMKTAAKLVVLFRRVFDESRRVQARVLMTAASMMCVGAGYDLEDVKAYVAAFYGTIPPDMQAMYKRENEEPVAAPGAN